MDQLPRWGSIARVSYKTALTAFLILWAVSLAASARVWSPLTIVWVSFGAICLVALLLWLVSEFVAGLRDRN